MKRHSASKVESPPSHPTTPPIGCDPFSDSYSLPSCASSVHTTHSEAQPSTQMGQAMDSTHTHTTASSTDSSVASSFPASKPKKTERKSRTRGKRKDANPRSSRSLQECEDCSKWGVIYPLYLNVAVTFAFVTCQFGYIMYLIPYLMTGRVQLVEESGEYVGLLLGMYFLGQAINGPVAGFLADRFGVIPILLLSSLTNWIFPLLFGTARTYFAANLIALFYGTLNSTLPSFKTWVHQQLPPEESKHAIAWIGTTTAFVAILAPTTGGLLSFPSEKYAAFRDIKLFQRYPFLLPNLILSCLGLCSIGTVLWVMWAKKRHERHCVQYLSDANAFLPIRMHHSSPSPSTAAFLPFLAKHPQVTRIVLIHGGVVALEVVISELYPLLLLLPKHNGGFGLSTNAAAIQNIVQGVISLVSSFMSPYLISLMGLRRSLRNSLLFTAPIVLFVPLLSQWHASGAVFLSTLLMGIGVRLVFQVAYTSVITMQNFTAEPVFLGRVNGFGAFCSAMGRFSAPSVLVPIFAWSVTPNQQTGLNHPFPLNHHLSFWVYALLAWILAWIVTTLHEDCEHSQCVVVTASDPLTGSNDCETLTFEGLHQNERTFSSDAATHARKIVDMVEKNALEGGSGCTGNTIHHTSTWYQPTQPATPIGIAYVAEN